MKPLLSQPQEADLIEYGAVSPLAIVALVLGLSSAVALANPLLLIVPLLAAVVSLAALGRIARSEGALVGRPAAAAGLALALLFAAAAVSQSVTRQVLLRSHARRFADGWLDIVRGGNLEKAHQLHLPAGQRQLAESDLATYYAINTSARDELRALFDQQPLDAVVAAPSDAKIYRVEIARQISEKDVNYFEILYELVPTAGPPARFLVVPQRTQTEKGGQWRIAAVKSPEPR